MDLRQIIVENLRGEAQRRIADAIAIDPADPAWHEAVDDAKIIAGHARSIEAGGGIDDHIFA
jgi:hypothetical protein